MVAILLAQRIIRKIYSYTSVPDILKVQVAEILTERGLENLIVEA